MKYLLLIFSFLLSFSAQSQTLTFEDMITVRFTQDYEKVAKFLETKGFPEYTIRTDGWIDFCHRTLSSLSEDGCSETIAKMYQESSLKGSVIYRTSDIKFVLTIKDLLTEYRTKIQADPDGTSVYYYHYFDNHEIVINFNFQTSIASVAF